MYTYIYIKDYRAHSYYNFINMSGRFNDMQYIIINDSQFAIWIPHAAHSLNLVGQNSVESSTIVAILFAFIPNQCNLFS